MGSGIWILIITMAVSKSEAQLEHIPAFTTKAACEEAATKWREGMEVVFPPQHRPGVITTRTSSIGWSTLCVYSGDYMVPADVPAAGVDP